MADQNSQYMAILTAVGEAKLANAQALGTDFNIAEMAVGDGGGIEPTPDRLQTALLNQRRRAPLNQLIIDPSNAAVIIAEQVIPEDIGGWWIREIALYDDAGDCVALANCPPTFKPQLAQGSGRTQVVRINLLVSSTQNITLRIDPSVVLATRAYADSIINVHNALPDPHPQYQLRGAITSLSANTSLTAAHEGLVLLSAQAGDRIFALPAANAALRVREYVLRRTDITNNKLTIAAAGNYKIMFDTAAESAGVSTAELLFSGDYLRLRCDPLNEQWWVTGQAELPASIASGMIVYTTPGAHTLTTPPVLRSGRRRAKVTVTGAGGGGAAGDTGERGGGGGAGATVIAFLDLAGVSTVAVTVGAGGRRGEFFAEGGHGPMSGGASSFGPYVSAGGGAFGTPPEGGSAGAGGVGSTVGAGGLVLLGGDGGDGNPIVAPVTRTGGGYGGSSFWGGGAAGRMGEITKNGVYGCGGAGGGNRTKGGAGADGIIVIEW